MITGFFFLWLTTVITSLNQQGEISGDFSTHAVEVSSKLKILAENLENFHKDAVNHERINTRLAEYLQVDLDCCDDDWLIGTIQNIMKIRKDSKAQSPIIQSFIKQSIDDATKTAAFSILGPGFRQEYQKSNELERMRTLKQIVSNSTHYAWAVTVDEGTYIKDFWSGVFLDEFLSVNMQITSLGNTKVHRIFVTDCETIQDTQSEKHKLIENIILQHPKSPNMEVRVIDKAKIANKSIDIGTSMIVCDDCMASESYSLKDGGSVPGYVVINDRAKITALKNRFQDLLSAPNENWVTLDGGMAGSSSGCLDK